MVISYNLGEFEVFLKITVIIIIRFGENNVLVTIYIDIYKLHRWAGRYIVPFTFICVLFIKTKKRHEHDQY